MAIGEARLGGGEGWSEKRCQMSRSWDIGI